MGLINPGVNQPLKSYFTFFLIFLAVEQGYTAVKRKVYFTWEGKVKEITPWERRGDEIYLEWKLSEGQWNEIETYEKESVRLQENNYLFRKLGLVTIIQIFGSKRIFGFTSRRKDIPRLLLSREEYLITDLIGGTIFSFLNKKEKIQSPKGKILLAFHTHTSYSRDSVQSIEKLLLDAERKGFKAIAITDHDRIDGALKAREIAQDLKMQGKITKNFLVIIGQEISSAQGHIVGLFLRSFVPSGMTAKATIAAIHKQGGVAIAVHPTQGTTGDLNRRLVKKLDFDAVELHNSTPKRLLPYYLHTNIKLNNGLKEHSFLFGGDEHISGSLGFLGVNAVETDEVSEEKIKQAFIEGKVSPYVVQRDFLNYLKFVRYKLNWVHTALGRYHNLKNFFGNTLAVLFGADIVEFYLNGDEAIYALFNFYGFFTEFALPQFMLKDNSPLREPLQIKNIVTSWGNLHLEFVAPLEKEYKINIKYMVPLYR